MDIISKDTSPDIRRSRSRCFGLWEQATEVYLKRPLLRVIVCIARISAQNPRLIVALVACLSITLAVAGFLTNFRIVADGEELWAPVGTRTLRHGKWVEKDSGFPAANSGYVAFLIHSHGDNVLTVEGAGCLFDAVDTIRNVDGYQKTCLASWEEEECPILSASALFHHNRTEFFQFFGSSDAAVQRAMSTLKYPSGQPVVRDIIFGYPEPALPANISLSTLSDYTDLIMTSATSYLGHVPKSESDEYNFEFDATIALYMLQEKWDQEGVACSIEANSYRALDDESQRGVEKDIPMMVLSFIIMGFLCALYLSNFQNLVQSRSILGLGSVLTIALSVMTGFGFMFLIGVPFTPIAQVFVYVMVGIGLDDTFIITGAYSRTDPNKDSIERIVDCMEEVGISIGVSTLTTVTAFSTGCATSMPLIRWFCIYAAPTVLIDFLYQISFFVALMVLDDQRIRNGRYDCLMCIKSKKDLPVHTTQQQDEDMVQSGSSIGTSRTSKFMSSYSKILLKPRIKVLVLVLFTVMTGLGIYGATQQRQELDFREMMPPDSFIRTYYDALHEYSSEYSYGLLFLRGDIYFRNVDVSSPEIQQQMMDYVEDVVNLPYISSPPEFFWLRDFLRVKEYLEETNEAFASLTFEVQLSLFLATPPFDVLYGKDIVRDSNGTVAASRCEIIFDKGSNYDVQVQIDTFRDQDQVAKSQPINNDSDNWSFFLFSRHFYAWQLHDLMKQELILTLVLGLASVFVISLIFIPHIFGALVLPPIVAAVYCQLMAFLYVVGIYVNVVSAIGLLMSIGLLVDYNMHVALSYYYETKNETSRDDKVHTVLTTMGASVFIGGVTTMTSALPLGLTASLVFQTFFYTFLAIPILGVANGLILLPVILSLWGPFDDDAAADISREGGARLSLPPAESSTTHDNNGLLIKAQSSSCMKSITEQDSVESASSR